MSEFITHESKNSGQPGVRYIGRFDFSEAAGPKFAWSASTIYAKFYGSSVRVKLRSFGDNYFLIIIDGKVIIDSLKLGEGEEKVFLLSSNLVEGEHEVSIVVRTEFYLGTAQFLGLDFAKGNILSSPVPLKRRIEIIGDSISCGFGNEATHKDIEYSPKYDNSYLSYGSIAARYLNAEHIIVGRSGFGLIRSYDGDKSNILPPIYSRILPDNYSLWDAKNFIPQVVVINLGTNDFSDGFIPNREEFTLAYINLVNKIHKNYPEAKVICSVGPVIEGNALEVSKDYIKNDVVEYISKDNNDWIYFLEFDHQVESDGYGVSGHPSLKTHELMGKSLANFVRIILMWKN
ncbi:SGNH/GDSL hydrolase family protein [Clostridium lacusfryxellense]|uniref:SGNH/GDSL hydrolase family protein n=1 Tax=Clostridium lacusfryxellense TaxID=205328 RepID=UPI001C0B86EC|nr:SGNH/GDSL hydrolase family protein [Clostridium lacusfryxellense]MBU3112149.1 acetyl xylan esterase [Clostridium lacusfryxellense]